MYRSTRPLRTALVFGLVLGGCVRPSPLSDGGASDPLAQLDAETGVHWSVRWHPDVHTPALLEGKTAPLATTANDAERVGRDWLRRHGALFGLGDDDDVSAMDAVTDELGMTHARFRQRVQDHDVWGGEMLLRFAADGSLVRLNGRFVPVVAPLGAAVQDADEARVFAVNAARESNPAWSTNAFTTYAPKLFAHPVDAQTVKLAWHVLIRANDDAGTAQLEYFVDAGNGSILHAADLTAYVDGSGVGVFGDRQPLVVAANGASFILEDASRGGTLPTRTYANGNSTHLPGTAVRSKDPQAWDTAGDGKGAAVDAHAFVAASWDYFANVHGRRGWDGSGQGVHSTVHYGSGYDQAFFDGTQLVFGDGDGALFSPLSGALDVVAHEFTHGLIANSAALGAEGQNGALHEAIADLFACFIEGNWQIGETIFHPNGVAAPLRDIANPHATASPVTLGEWVTTSDDNGGVHLNSTIVSHAGYVMATSGKLPRATVEKIWFRALAYYLWSRADFAAAADATLAAAKDLGNGAETPVHDAWVAAGVVQ